MNAMNTGRDKDQVPMMYHLHLLRCVDAVRLYYTVQNLASQLIGRGGSSISRWEKESRATIKLKARAHGGGSDIVITGSQRHVAVSVCLLGRLLLR